MSAEREWTVRWKIKITSDESPEMVARDALRMLREHGNGAHVFTLESGNALVASHIIDLDAIDRDNEARR